jgi:ABC-type branched-subunit amino acid transport system substrate-binding protein
MSPKARDDGAFLEMRSTCPDGVVIVTAWPDGWNPNSLHAQDMQATWHRSDVRAHLKYAAILDRAA